MKLNYFGATQKAVGSHGFSENPADEHYEFAIENILKNRAHNMLGWVDLPNPSLEQKDEIAEIKKHAKWVRENFKHFVVLGIGGSALGTRAVWQALGTDIMDCHVLDNIDPDSLVPFMRKLDIQKTYFCAISKSGGTSETVAQMLYAIELLKGVKKDWQQNFAVITEKNSKMNEFSVKHGLKTFYVPQNVGGRFSVLCPVGLFPLAVAGNDIDGILQGAAEFLGQSKKAKNNPAFSFALANHFLMKNGKSQLVLFPYSDRLALFADFAIQIWAESLGKEVNLSGKKVNVGQTPLKAVGVTDQHSIVQLFMEGPNDKVYLFFSSEKALADVPVSNTEVPSLSFLHGTTFYDLLQAEKNATMFALVKKGRPVFELALPEISPVTIGQLILFFELATAFAGEFLYINAFDQPGVELGKIYTKALLGAAGSEKQKKEIEAFMEKQKQFVIE